MKKNLENKKLNVWICDLTYTQQTIASDTIPMAIGCLATYAEKHIPWIKPIKIFKYPAWTKGQESVELLGHAPQIGKVLFLNNGVNNDYKQLISIGAKDRAIFVWKVGCAEPLI